MVLSSLNSGTDGVGDQSAAPLQNTSLPIVTVLKVSQVGSIAKQAAITIAVMKNIWQAGVDLILLSTIAMMAGAQTLTEAPLPEAATLVQKAILQQQFAETKEREYVLREDFNSNTLRKECTRGQVCRPPFDDRKVHTWTNYQVLKYTTRHFEVFWLDGIRVVRVLPENNSNQYGTTGRGEWTRDIPTSESELAIENQRVDSEIAEARALRAQGKPITSPDDPPQILLSRMLELCVFSNPRREAIGGRSTILLDFAWNPTRTPTNANETLLKYFLGTVGIDEEDHGVEHVEGRFFADVKSEGGMIEARKGTWVKIQNKRMDTGVWLLLHLRAWGQARYSAFELDGDGNLSAGAYRKFQTTIRILPGLTEVPKESATPRALQHHY
ncbi:MAG: hypothetical protein ABR905_08195 [Terracidiphilus sp.]